ncbi:MAG: DUF885 domain-containing protein, partial [Pseudomonas sp.]|nr:DUF885 domain-containing protein [Pseudomonas sp.]
MIHRLLLTAAIIAALSAAPSASPAQAQSASPAVAPASPAAKALHALFDAEWERDMRENPENASYRGDNRYNDRWTDLSLAAIAQREATDRQVLAQLRAIDRSALSEQDKLNYDVFLWQQQKAVERQKYKEWQRPLSQRGGVQNAEGIAEVLRFSTAK